MKKILNIFLTLSLFSTLSFNIAGCKNTNNTQYDNVKDAISSLENQTFHISIKNVQKISFTGNDWRKKRTIW